MSLSSRIAGDSCKFGDQMRHDHQQHKPYKSVHGCDNYLQNRKKRHFLIASKQHARHAISLRTSLSKLILVDLVIKCELHHNNCNRAVEALLKVKLMPPYANPRMRLRRGLVDHVLRRTISRQNAFEPRSSSGSSSCCRLWGILKCGLAQGQLAVAVAVAAARAAFAQACNQFFLRVFHTASFSQLIFRDDFESQNNKRPRRMCSQQLQPSQGE